MPTGATEGQKNLRRGIEKDDLDGDFLPKGKGGTKEKGEMQEVRKRSVDMASAWINAQIAGGNGPVAKTERAFLMWLRRSLRKKLEDYIKTGGAN